MGGFSIFHWIVVLMVLSVPTAIFIIEQIKKNR